MTDRPNEPWMLYGLLIPPATAVLTLLFAKLGAGSLAGLLSELAQLTTPQAGGGMFVFFGLQGLAAALAVLFWNVKVGRRAPLWLPVIKALTVGIVLLLIPEKVQTGLLDGFYFRGLLDQFYGVKPYLLAQLLSPALVWVGIRLAQRRADAQVPS